MISSNIVTEKRAIHPGWTRPFASIGRTAMLWTNNLGASAVFLYLALRKIVRPKQLPKVVQQTYYIGARSTMIILLIGLFTGMVLGLQSYHALVKFGAEGALGTLVALSLVRELGPVLTAIMITARAGSAMTAEIGIQRISEQIDALGTMRIPPIPYLITPRITASLIAFPCSPPFLTSSALPAATSPGYCCSGRTARRISTAFRPAWN